MAVNHQSPQSTSPALTYKQLNTTTWGATPNTCTISDAYIKANSQLVIYVTGTTPQAGRWSYTVAQGSVVITSSDAESSTLPISYIVL